MTSPAEERHVVVGVDGSPPSRLALQWAQFMAHALNATVDAVAVWEITAVEATEWSDVYDPAKEAASALHTIVAEVLGSPPGEPVREIVHQGQGNTASELVQASQGAQLLVVGSRGHSGFAGHLLGSVSKAVAEHAHCPVLIIHGDTPPPPRA
jgi:nucleotide-binding universal stress UspA family protein